MVPVRLELHNFLSYGANVPPLDLSGLGMACLSGPNGHGKSAILDAITWALWGEARKGGGAAKPHAGLVRSGETEMWVVLDFDHEGQRYRVRRAYKLSGSSGRLDLDFRLWDAESSQFVVLNRPTAARTDQEIVRRVHMDHDTFVNSAFLKQGRADEFTRRRPAERKQILGEILNLSRYDRLRDLARRRLQGLDQALAVDSARIAALELELADSAETRARLDEVAATVAIGEAELERWESELAELAEALASDRVRRERIEALASSARQAEHDLDLLRRDLATSRDSAAELQRLVEERVEVEALQERLTALEEERRVAEQALARRRELEARRERLGMQIDITVRDAEAERRRQEEQVKALEQKRREADSVLQRRERIRQQIEAQEKLRERLEAAERDEERHRRLSQQLQEVERRVEKARLQLEASLHTVTGQLREARQRADQALELRQRLEAARAALTQAEAADQELTLVRLRIGELAGEFRRLRACNDQLAQRIEELDRHQAILNAGEGECPVCRQPLSAGRLTEVRDDYASRRSEADAELRELRAEGRRLKAEKSVLEARLESLEQLGQTCAERSREVARTEQLLAQAEEAEAEHRKLEEQVRELKARLGAGDYGAEDHLLLRELRRELGELEYQPEQLSVLRRGLDARGEVERERLRLEQAEKDAAQVEAELPPLRESLAELTGRLRHETIALAERAELAEAQREIDQIAVDGQRLTQLDEALRQLADVPLRLHRIDDASQRLPAERARAEELAERVGQRERNLREIQCEQMALTEQLLDREALQHQHDELGERVGTARQALLTQRDLRARLQESVDRHRRQDEELQSLRAQLKQASRERMIAEQLAAAFGRDGIPALIIENAVPEIEREANELLGRLSGYRLQIAIRLQKPLQSGGERETLEIEISDELGRRSYENYSGGEAFRVDFALRLALSQLLAKRVQARLRTLVIDEGFGTQDDEGIDQLVEALHTVRDDFDLILVVTHLTALKDRFPSRVEIYKDPASGSNFTVFGGLG